MMVVVTFMEKAIEKVALIFLHGTSESCKFFVFSFRERLKTGWKLIEQSCCSIFKKVEQIILKFERLFARNLASHLL